MLEVFFGNDTSAVRQAVQTRAASLRQAGVELTTLDKDTYTPGSLRDAVGSTSLFGGELGFVLDSPAEDEAFMAEAQEQVEAMASSPNVFVVLEGPLLAAKKKVYTQHAAIMEEYKAQATERFNTFALADALAGKQKKQLWLLLQEARQAGQSAEAIIGVLWWQLKSLRLAELTDNAAAAGVKDFPYNKAKRALPNFQAGELTQLSHTLLELYHAGHAGRRDIDDALEQWVLTL